MTSLVGKLLPILLFIYALPRAHGNNQLLVILLDGFKWDYLNLIDEEHRGGFNSFINQGVKAEYVEAIFPSLSYPSWTTLSTGVYPENHGILGNYFYNRKQDAIFALFNTTLTSREDWWQHAEPIWTTATKNKLKVATVLWSRSDVPVHGILPEVAGGFFTKKGSDAIVQSLDKSLEYLEAEYDLVMMYGEHIDNVGHRYGTESREIKDALIEVGGILGNFLQKLEDKGLHEKVNILIVSDHGMTSCDTGVTFINIEDYISLQDVQYIFDRGAIMSIFTQPNKLDTVYEQLKSIKGTHIYKKDEIPSYLHYREIDLLPDILVTAEPAFLLKAANSSKQVPYDKPKNYCGGLHGYKPAFKDMRTIFFAKGPNFQEGYASPKISLVDIYQLYPHLLMIPPQPNNGTWSKVKDMLRDSAHIHSGSVFLLLFIQTCIVLFK